MRNFWNFIGLEQWYFSLVWNTHVKITTPLRVVVYKQIIAWFVCDIFWRKYHLWYFKIVSNFTCRTAREITYNSFEISLVVFMSNITTNHTITYTNINFSEIHVSWPAPSDSLSVPIYSLLVPSSVSQIWPSTESPSQMRPWDVQGQVYRIPQLASMKSVKLCLQLTQDWKKVKKSSPQKLSTKCWSTDGHLSTDDGLREGWLLTKRQILGDVLLYFYRTLKLTKPQTTQSGLIRKGDS